MMRYRAIKPAGVVCFFADTSSGQLYGTMLDGSQVVELILDPSNTSQYRNVSRLDPYVQKSFPEPLLGRTTEVQNVEFVSQ